MSIKKNNIFINDKKKETETERQRRENIRRNLRPQKITTEMQDFIKKNFPDQVNDESMYTRRHLMTLLSEYIKSKNILNQENKKQWSGKDKTLKKLFNLQEEWYSFMKINSLVSSVHVKNLEKHAVEHYICNHNFIRDEECCRKCGYTTCTHHRPWFCSGPQ